MPDNQISINFEIPDNQISLRFEVPDKQISLHLGVPNNCLLSISSQPGPGPLEQLVDPQMEWNLLVGDFKTELNFIVGDLKMEWH